MFTTYLAPVVVLWPNEQEKKIKNTMRKFGPKAEEANASSLNHWDSVEHIRVGDKVYDYYEHDAKCHITLIQHTVTPAKPFSSCVIHYLMTIA